MKSLSMKFALLSFVLSSFVAGQSFAAVMGDVTLEGKKPSPTQLRMNADPYCKKYHKDKKVFDRTTMVLKDNKIKNAFVYVKSGLSDAQKKAKKPEDVVLDQEGCLYKPKVLGLVAGQEFKVKNSDATLHNVRTSPKKNAGFNVAMPTKGQTLTKKFMKPEEGGITFKCDVHPWMSSTMYVLDHAYYFPTTSKGRFKMDLPDGSYTLSAKHVTFGEVTEKITVADGKAKEGLIRFKMKK